MIEKYTPADVLQLTGRELQVADRITDQELAVLGQIPLNPTVFNYIDGVLRGDTTVTRQYYGLLEWARQFNNAVPAERRINTDLRNPEAFLARMQSFRATSTRVEGLFSEHESYGREKREIVNEMRSESLAGLAVLSGGIERIDDEPGLEKEGLLPLYIDERQVSALALQVRARRDLETRDVLLGPVDGQTRLIVVTDTSESDTANFQRFSEGDAQSFPDTFDPLDTHYQREISAETMDLLSEMGRLTVERIMPGIDVILRVLTSLRGQN